MRNCNVGNTAKSIFPTNVVLHRRRSMPVGENCGQTRRHEAADSFAALNKGVTKLSEKRRKPLEIGRGIKRKKREGK